MSAVGDLRDDRQVTVSTYAQLPSGTVTFLMTDVEGSTRLWEAHPDEMDAVLTHLEQLVADVVAGHGGHRPVEQGEGDSSVAVFRRAEDALGAAWDLQLAIVVHVWPGGVAPAVRIGIHTGVGTARHDGTYRSVALHRCARIRGLAHGGQVLVSDAAARLAAEEVPAGAALRSLGQHRLRDLTLAERLFQLERAGEPTEFPPLRSVDTVENNLPVQLTSFVGRRDELAAVAGLLDHHRMVTFAGVGGCGKTRLAVQAAADRVDRVEFVWFVDLAPVVDADGVTDQVLRAAGLKQDATRSLAELVRSRVLDAPALVVLDNCEHVIDAASAVAEELLAAAPAVTVIATSREPLGVPGEVVSRVPSLSTHVDPTASGLVESEAVQLFVERCGLVRPGYEPRDQDLTHITSICERVDGIPLAIELAAARTRVMSLEEVSAGLRDRFRLLTGGGRALVPRHQTLRASIDWSYSLLDEQERAVLRRLAVFAGGFTLTDAEAMIAGDDVAGHVVLDLVTRLVDKSLVVAHMEVAPTRFRMLETIRQYAEERLADAAEAHAARQRHAEVFSALARAAAPGLDGPDLEAWVARLGEEHANLTVAFGWLIDREDAPTAWTMLGDLTFYWASVGNFADARRIFEWCLAHDDGNASRQLPARWGAAHLAFYAGDYLRAYDLAIDALARAEVVGDGRHAARSLNTAGTIESSTDPLAALDKVARASELARDNGDLWCAADAGQIAGYTHLYLGNVDEAVVWFDRTLPDARHLDSAQLLAWDLGGRGWVAVLRGDFTRALELLDSADRQARRTGDPNITGVIDYWRSQVLAAQGDPAATTLAEHALASATRAGAGFAELVHGFGVALTYATAGELAQAEAAYQRHIDVLAEFYPIVGVRLVVVGAALAYMRHDLVVARERIARGHAIAPPGVLADPAMLDIIAALLDAQQDMPADLAAAEAAVHAALRTLNACGSHLDRLDALEALGVIVAKRGHQLEAVRIWGARDSDAQRHDVVATVIHRAVAPDRAKTLAEADPATTNEALAAGAALDLDELLTYIDRARGDRKRPSSGWDSLTPTELEVVTRAATGLSNSEIGKQMFIGAGTVKTHLAHVYVKLNVANRTELTAALARRAH